MKKQLLTGVLATSTLALTALAQTSPAEALVFSFSNITGNNLGDATIGENQLSVDVTDAGANQVSFLFQNIGGDASSITDIYFENRSAGLLGGPSLNPSAGVSFALGAAPPNLPGANNATPPFVTSATAQFTADSNPPAQPNGVNPGETLEIIYDLSGGVSFNDVIAALQNPDFSTNGTSLRLGIHVQGFASGGSESFVNNPTPVPTPAAVLPTLFGMGVAALRSKKQDSEVTQEA